MKMGRLFRASQSRLCEGEIGMKRLWLILGFCLIFQGQARADFAAGLSAYENEDFETALQEFQPLAIGDDARAQYFIGEMLLRGKGIEADVEQAVLWLTKAAENGSSDAQVILGGLYAAGIGVEQDFDQAYFWLIIAVIWSDAGSPLKQQAMANLGAVAQILSPEQKKAAETQARRNWGK